MKGVEKFGGLGKILGKVWWDFQLLWGQNRLRDYIKYHATSLRE